MNRRHFIGSIPALASCLVAGGAAVAPALRGDRQSRLAMHAASFRSGGWLTRDEVKLIEGNTLVPPAPLVIEIKADLSVFARQFAELKSLWLEAGDVPELLLHELNGLTDELGSELAFGSSVSTSGAGQQIVEIGFREGGKFDRIAAALRALRDGREFGHGDLRV